MNTIEIERNEFSIWIADPMRDVICPTLKVKISNISKSINI